MNSRQRAVLAVGILATLALGLFPPCAYRTPAHTTRSELGLGKSVVPAKESPGGHHFVFSADWEENLDIDYRRWLTLLGIVGVTTVAGIALFKK